MAVIALLLAISFSAGAQTRVPVPAQKTTTTQQQTPQVKVVVPPKALSFNSLINEKAGLKIMKNVMANADANKFFIKDETVLMEKNSMGAAIDVNWGSYNPDDFVWESTCKGSIVTVDIRGNVKPKTIGITNIILTSKDGTLKDECKVYVVDKFISATSVVGKGIDAATAAMVSGDYLKPSTVLDVDLLNIKGRWQEDKLSGSSHFEAVAGESASEVIKEFNTRNKISYGGWFSASAQVNYKSNSQVNRASGFVRAQAQIRVKNENITGSLSPANLKEFVTSHFIDDLNKLSASQMLANYGSHVIAKCYWGGVVQLDFTHSSVMCSSSSDLEIIVKASAFGVSASSANNLKEMKKDFDSNSSFSIENTGGKISATSVDDFKKKYDSWVNSVISNNVLGGPKLCGIDEMANLIPIWEFAKLFNANKAKVIEEEFEKNRKTGEGILNGINSYPVRITDISPLMMPRVAGVNMPVDIMKAVSSTNTHAVLQNGTDMNNGKSSVAAHAGTPIGYVLETNANKNNSVYSYIHYKVEQLADIKGKAISDLVIVNGNAAAPSGYTKISNSSNSLNFCGQACYFAYKKAIKDDDWVIDFIGGYNLQSSSLPALPASTNTRKWEYVKYSNNNNAANTAQGSGGYVYLIVRKVKASQ